MNMTPLMIGILPLLAFVIIDSFSGLKSALISAIIFAIIEALFSYFYFGELDFITLISVLLVIILAIVSYKLKSPTFIKFQPVIISAFLGVLLIFTYFLGKPIFYELSVKYKEILPPHIQIQLSSPILISYLKLISLNSGIALIFHAIATAFAAIKLNKWCWITIRVIGFYVLLLIAAILTSLYLSLSL